jgi:hypothetical protein
MLTFIELVIADASAVLQARPRRTAHNHEVRIISPQGKTSKSTLGCIVREADPAIFDKASEPVPTLEHVVDRLGDRGRERQARALLTQPYFQSSQKGRALFLAHTQTLFGDQAVMLRSMSNSVSMRLTTANATGEIVAAFFPRLA